MLPKKGQLLRIFIGEEDHHAGAPLFEWIVRKAKEHDLAGATVIRGIEGYGASTRLHSAKVLRLSCDLPIIIEIVDEKQKIEAFLPVIDQAIKQGLATIEDIDIRFYRAEKPQE